MRLYEIHNTAAVSQVQVYPRLKTFDTTTSTPLFVDLFFLMKHTNLRRRGVLLDFSA